MGRDDGPGRGSTGVQITDAVDEVRFARAKGKHACMLQ